MKQAPDMQKLEAMLRSSKLVAGGFMGDDDRSVEEVINADAAKLEKAGVTAKELAQKMQSITDAATKGLGTWVWIDEDAEAMVDEAKGLIVCPWPHTASFDKRVTIIKKGGVKVRWSDLSIHMIGEHGFFEGKGSTLRVEPQVLIKLLF